MVSGFGGFSALSLGVIGQYLRLSLQNVRNRPTLVVIFTPAFVHRESAAAKENVMKFLPRTDATDPQANLAVNAQVPTLETQAPDRPDLAPAVHSPCQPAPGDARAPWMFGEELIEPSLGAILLCVLFALFAA